jgi:hypothetical protein
MQDARYLRVQAELSLDLAEKLADPWLAPIEWSGCYVSLRWVVAPARARSA